MEEDLLEYFNGDEFAASTWKKKYAAEGERTPVDTHRRMAKEFAKIEQRYANKILKPEEINGLSDDGADLLRDGGLKEEEIFDLFDHFKYVIPGGSVMASLGTGNLSSLSNCFVIDSPEDSYQSIMEARTKQVQLMKRRGGVGYDLSKLRPKGAKVDNSSKISTGAASFMDVDSDITNEVAQNGRRGALMLTMSINHPDIEEFITKKQDLKKVTGANISVKVNDEFMEAVVNDKDYMLRWPVDFDLDPKVLQEDYPYGELVKIGETFSPDKRVYLKKIRAKELWDTLMHCAWNTAEPGIIFESRMWNYSPDGVYDDFKMISTNPCLAGETKVLLADGRGWTSIKELADLGQDVPVFCLDHNGNICIQKMRHPRVTGYNIQLYKLKLANGIEIRCTENHKFLDSDGHYVELRDLRIGDLLIVGQERPYDLKREFGSEYQSYQALGVLNKGCLENYEIAKFHNKGLVPNDCTIEHWDGDTLNNHVLNLFISKDTCLDDLSSAEKASLKMKYVTALATGYSAIINNGRVQVKKECEICGLPFWVDYDYREISFCSDECIKDYQKGKRFIYHEIISGGIIAEDDVHLPLEYSKSLSHIVSIEPDGREDVYNGTVDKFHNFFVGGQEASSNGLHSRLFLINKQCGEIGMGAPRGKGDSCRLIHINLSSFVKDAKFDYAKLKDVAYKTTWIADDLVDLEIEAVRSIIEKLSQSNNNEFEKSLWEGLLDVGQQGRRCGIGFTGLADAIAKMGLQYCSSTANDEIYKILHSMFEATLKAEIDLGIIRGSFKAYNPDIEYLPITAEPGNDFYKFIDDEYSELAQQMKIHGRRNISWTTVAPTGTVSIMAQCSSGIEPIFLPYYERKRKCMSSDDPVDYVDKVGQRFSVFTIVHPGLKEYAMNAMGYSKEEIDKFKTVDWERIFRASPYYQSIAPEIDWRSRVKLQGIIQKFITHSCSSTINLPNETTEEGIKDLYIESWKHRLKGITIYRDGCREGVITKLNDAKSETLEVAKAPKRPKELPADFYTVRVKGTKFAVIVGLFDEKPYEVFAYQMPKDENGEYVSIKDHYGKIIKKSKMHYKFESNQYQVEDLLLANDNIEEKSCTLYCSMLLRHGIPIKYVIKTTKKVNDNITSFSSALCRVLGKYQPTDKSYDVCPKCGGRLVHDGGCIRCLDCTYSKCL